MAYYKHIANLIARHRRNDLNDQEKEELEAWRNLNNDNQLLFNRLNDSDHVLQKLGELHSVDPNEEWGIIRQMFPRNRRKRTVTVLKYAAVITVLLTGGIIAVSLLKPATGIKTANKKSGQHELNNGKQPDVHRVELKLADGRIVYLDSSVSGHIALQYNSVIYKRGDRISYDWSTGNGHREIEYNTVSTPRARTFAVELPDGSKAWLNATSSITYPTAFTGPERAVQITGEVYFEVNPDAVSLQNGGKKKPFVVVAGPPSGNGNGARIEVTGTHFNVNAYAEELAIKTTLFEGKVKVVNRQSSIVNKQPATGTNKADGASDKQEQFVVLTPGQQAQVNSEGRVEVIKYADIQEVMAWHKGKFVFNDTDVKKIMQQISRMYDYEIVYDGPVGGHYTFTASRQKSITDILEYLEMAGGIHFDIEGKKIIVSP